MISPKVDHCFSSPKCIISLLYIQGWGVSCQYSKNNDKREGNRLSSVHALGTTIILPSPLCRSKGETVLEQHISISQRRMRSGKLILPILRSHNNRLNQFDNRSKMLSPSFETIDPLTSSRSNILPRDFFINRFRRNLQFCPDRKMYQKIDILNRFLRLESFS